MTQSAVATPAKSSSRIGQILRVAFVLFVLVKLASFMYFLFFDLLSANPLHEMVTSAHVDDALAFENHLLGIVVAPMMYGVLAAICPLFGWWIYARVEKTDRDAVGWGSATLFSVVNIFLGLLNQGVLARMGIVMDALSTIVGMLIIILYVMLFMTIGFVTASIFKLKL